MQSDPTLGSGVIRATTIVGGDVARGIAGAAGGATDTWADVFRSSSPPSGIELPPRKPGVPAPLHELPDVLERNGAPGVPSLPAGAPHGPLAPRRTRREAPLPAPPEVNDRFAMLPEETPPANARSEKPPAKARKDDDVLLPMALAGLSLVSGVV
jgi:hypothetical protein